MIFDSNPFRLHKQSVGMIVINDDDEDYKKHNNNIQIIYPHRLDESRTRHKKMFLFVPVFEVKQSSTSFIHHWLFLSCLFLVTFLNLETNFVVG